MRKSFAFGDDVQGVPIRGCVEKRGKRVRLAAAERGYELQYAIAGPAVETRENVRQQ